MGYEELSSDGFLFAVYRYQIWYYPEHSQIQRERKSYMSMYMVGVGIRVSQITGTLRDIQA